METVSRSGGKQTALDDLADLIPQSHLRFWKTPELSAPQITLSLPGKCIDEIRKALAKSAEEISVAAVSEGFDACRKFARELSAYLDHHGPGAAIIDRFPAEDYNEYDNRRMCGLFSLFVGQLMEQNHAGVTLYDVKNTNPKDPSTVRKSITNHAQPFHTDGGWYRKPAKYVGLYCVRNAKEGGGSLVTSLVGAYQELLNNPLLAKELTEAVAWDRQGEHASGDTPYEMNPVFEASGGEFLTRYYESYIHNGTSKKGATLTPRYLEALQAFNDAILNQPKIEFAMSAGQFQYVNNWTVAHARKSFADTEATPVEHSRHVIRVWNH